MPGLLGEMGYDPFGLPRLRAGLAAHMTRLGVPTDPDEIVVTSGAQQAVHLIASPLGGPGSAVGDGGPDLHRGHRRVPHDRQPAAPDPGRRRRPAHRGHRAARRGAPLRLVYVVPTFHNPTGVTMPAARRRELVRLAAELGFRIVEDLTPDATLGVGVPPPIAAFDPGDRVITVGSLSKIAWGGLRIGWVRASRADIDRLVAAKIVADHSTQPHHPGHRRPRPRADVEAIAAQTIAVAAERRRS